MYTEFFNLREMPFTITPDPAYLYLSPRHQEALGHLLYGTGQYGGFVQLTGEVGTGKTTIVRTLLEQKLTDVDVAMIHNPRQNEHEFVQSICDELGVDYDRGDITLKALVDVLNAHLLRVHAAGRRTVLIIDEAQNLPRDVLEQVRLLTNLETHKEKLLRIMLIGQPELAELLARPDLRQLASRITARYHLMPLSEAETGEYVRHRLRVAGSSEPLFAEAAIREIHRYTRGVPRLINILCDRALLGAYSLGARQVSPDIVRKAAVESLGAPMPITANNAREGGLWTQLVARAKRRPLMVWLERGLTVLALLIAVALFYQTFFDSPSSPPTPSQEVGRDVAPKEARQPPAPAAADTVASTTEKTAAPTPPPAAGSDARKPEAVAKPVAAPAAAKPDAAAATPAPAATPAAVSTDLTTLLQSTQPLPTVVGRLIRLWDRDLVIASGTNVCGELSGRGLQCYKSNGEWADLRAINRPAILSITTGRGELQHVLLRGLSATLASIDTARGTLTLPLEQLDALWTGEFLVLWRRDTAETYLTPGMRGAGVVWVRKRLAEIDNRTLAEPVSDRYDEALADALRHFQSKRGLDADGVVGLRTLIALGERVPGTPTLGALQ